MPPKNNSRPAGKPAAGPLKPLRLRDVPGLAASAKAARRPLVPTHVSGPANHALHHVARHSQA